MYKVVKDNTTLKRCVKLASQQFRFTTIGESVKFKNTKQKIVYNLSCQRNREMFLDNQTDTGNQKLISF